MVATNPVLVRLEVGNASNRRLPVSFVLDSNAPYSVLPEDVWRGLGLRPKREVRFILPDGGTVTRAIGEAHFTCEDADGWCPVVLGEPGTRALLSPLTLDVLGLTLDPGDHQPRPMRVMIAWSAAYAQVPLDGDAAPA